MSKITIEFEVSDDFMQHLKRIKKQYDMTPQHFAEEAIYAYQTQDWSSIKSMTVDSPLQERKICYTPKKK